MAQSRPRRQIEVGWLEAVLLMLGYVASLAIVGLGGVYVGERSVQQRLGARERIMRLPVPSGTPADRDDAQEPNITFYDTLGQPEEPVREGRLIVPEKKVPGAAAAKQGAAQAVEAAPPAPKTAPPAAVEPVAPFARAATPTVAPAPPGAQAPASPTQAPPPAAKATAPARTRAAEPLATAERGAGREEPPDRSATAPAAAVPRGLPAPPPGVTPEAAATARALLGHPLPGAQAPQAGVWSVQVNATQEDQVARELVDRLRRRGYDAFLVTQVRDGVTWYRVRVGRLPSLEMANTLVVQLKEREGLPHAFVASD
jgi:cell division septation protein DedD